MESLAKAQQQLGKNIEQNYENFTKDGKERKTEDYAKQRSAILRTNWSIFESNHQALVAFEETHGDHLYFKNHYFEQVKRIYLLHQTGLGEIQTTGKHGTVESDSKPQTEVAQLRKRQSALLSYVKQALDELKVKLTEDQPIHFIRYKVTMLRSQKQQLDEIDQNLYIIDDNYPESTQRKLYFDLDLDIQLNIIYLQQKLETSPEARSSESAIKLPKITLPEFDGNYLKWLQFKDLFKQMVHSQNISDAQKMFYLVNNLTGEARTLVQHLPVCSQNYTTAWEILTHRYDNTRLLATAFLHKFMNQPSVQPESANSIKRLHDTTKECLLGLRNLGIDIDNWDAILIHILLKKLDKTTHILYEQSLDNPRILDKVSNVLVFLETRFQSLETISNKPNYGEKSSHDSKHKTASLFTNSERAYQCVVCKQNHPLFACKEFLEKTIPKRSDVVRNYKLCSNCLKTGHKAADCSSRNCTKCSKKHNTLLHRDDEKHSLNKINQSNTSNKEDSKAALIAESSAKKSYVLLGTIQVTIKTNNGKLIKCRALLDSGSQLNCITKKLANQLSIKGVNDPIKIQGIGKQSNEATRKANIKIRSHNNGYFLELEATILPQITSQQPSTYLETTTWNVPTEVILADPDFFKPGPVDILIGAEHYYTIIKDERIRIGKNLPVLQNTKFGWIVAGKTNVSITPRNTTCFVGTKDTTNLDSLVESFWKIETIDESSKPMTNAERKCEAIFKETTRRNDDGRFIVTLPFSQNPSTLGDSKEQALCRFLAIERKLNKDPELKRRYTEFMEEYISLGHMTEISEATAPSYFLPHHCVLKPDSETTKLRVVFDASAKTSKNISLNDVLYTGPKVQEDLFSVLLRFRFPRYVCMGDIKQMYRQILVDKHHRKFQLIFWRNDLKDAIQIYQLNTVTYGITTAPYLAIRCLQTLADEHRIRKPLGAQAIKENMYVDDAMFGADSLSEALATQQQMVEILDQGKFHLRKWCGNHQAFTKNLPVEDTVQSINITDESEQQVKALGLTWLPNSDEFLINVNQNSKRSVTKRHVLSDIARIFDPLGLVGPVTVSAKIFLRELWKLGLDWDEPIPEHLQATWSQFYGKLNALNDFRITRHVSTHKLAKSQELHIFCDASDDAYGAAAYIRSTLADGVIIVRLLCAKSRVAPMEEQTTPRLELCAAKLGTDLLTRLKDDLRWQGTVGLWSDNTTVLSWLTSPSSSLQNFVANRVAAIQEVTTASQWRYVPSKQNPADLISRGTWPDKLRDNHQWFYGPLFLYGPEETWPRKESTVSLPIVEAEDGFVNSLSHISSILRMNRIVAFALRFIHNTKPKNRIFQGDLSVLELEDAMVIILKEVQSQTLSKDLYDLTKHREVGKTTKINSLAPVLDDNGLIRVGGRLENANIPFDAKHPILLPYPHNITRLIMQRIHFQNNHIGQQGLLAMTRQKYWPINGKTVARSIVQNCVICAKQRPKLLQQIMGNLPKDRVQPSRPFLKTGVDFCGPFYVRLEIRGKPPQKAYVAVFCCFATKAVHLEVVKNLTTDAFIQALKRFIGRRGHCDTIYCDNATNFVGANNQLKELEDIIRTEKATKKINEFCTTRKITFKFSPPRAPHFGGLWEAAVKSAKGLFYTTFSTTRLTYEELTTVTVEIESILNSRPLTPISEDPNDLSALTPGHLLIGEPINSTVSPYTHPNPLPLVEKWKELTQLKHQFWIRWSKEYLSQLQERQKWKSSQDNVKIGTMVIVKEDNLPISSWPLGRIINVIKGQDGRVRVVDVKTAAGVFKRPVHKLAPLPVQVLEEPDSTTSSNPSTSKPMDPPLRDSRSTRTKPVSTSTPRASTSNLGWMEIPPGTSKALHNDPVKTTSSETSTPIKTKSSSAAKKGDESKAKKKCKSSLLLTTLLVLCCICPPQTASTIEVTQFFTQPGLYFENVGSVSMVADEWNLIVYYDMKPFWAEYDLITKGGEQLNRICSHLKGTNTCSETMEHFQLTMAELNNLNDLLKNTYNKRHKRGAFDIIGNVANSLFGVLDSYYAERMALVINQLEDNDQHLIELVKNQTTIMDSTSNLIRKSNEATQKQLLQFYKYLNLTANTANNISRAVEIQGMVETFNSLSIRLILAISNFQRMQGTLVNVLTDTQHGKISPHLITPAQLFQQIQRIKDNLPAHLRPPVDSDNILRLYGLMEIQGRALVDQIIFRVRIPLLSDIKFDLLAITAVPIIRNDTFTVIKPTSKFVIINLRKDHYYHIQNHELLTVCSLMSQAHYLCKLKRPPLNKTSKTGTCEIDILFHRSSLPACEFEIREAIPRWIPLFHDNQWIYATLDDIIINVICGNQLSQQHLKGTGTITLPSGCSIKDDQTTLETSHSFTNTITAPMLPTRNITDVIATSKFNNRLSFHSPEVYNMSLEVQQLQRHIQGLQQQASLPHPELTKHDIHQFGISYICLAIILVAAGYFLLRHFRIPPLSRRVPTPAPRTSIIVQDQHDQPTSSDFVTYIHD